MSENTDKTAKEGIKSPPPPYTHHEQNLDTTEEFPQVDTPSTDNKITPHPIVATPQLPQQQQVSPAISPPSSMLTPPTTPQTGEFPTSNSKIEDYQNDIFKKPPKFLLYPSPSQTEETDKFKEVSPESPRPATVEQSQPKQEVPAVFAVPCTPPAPADTGPSEEYLPPIPNGKMARYSQRAMCPQCEIPVTTSVEYVDGTVTHTWAFLGLFILCCCLPYFLDDLRDVEHVCPHCNTIIGYNEKRMC